MPFNSAGAVLSLGSVVAKFFLPILEFTSEFPAFQIQFVRSPEKIPSRIIIEAARKRSVFFTSVLANFANAEKWSMLAPLSPSPSSDKLTFDSDRLKSQRPNMSSIDRPPADSSVHTRSVPFYIQMTHL
jgi:hypothetical protein